MGINTGGGFMMSKEQEDCALNHEKLSELSRILLRLYKIEELDLVIQQGIERVIGRNLHKDAFKAYRDISTNTHVITPEDFDGNWENVKLTEVMYKGKIYGYGYNVFELKENGN